MRTSVGLTALALPTLSLAKRQMYLSRHCVRTSDNDDAIANYTTHSMPDWGVADGWCTEGGTDIMVKTGKDLVDSFGFDPARVRFISDPMMRDADTAFYLMQGMGIQHAAIDFDKLLFNPAEGNLDGTENDHTPCHSPSSDQTISEIRARYPTVPVPSDYKTALAELQEIIGVGPAGRLDSLEDIGGPDAEIVLNGGVRVMAEFGQAMLYAYASNIPFLNVTKEQINKFAAWHAWWMNVAFVDTSAMAIQHSFLLHRILDDLKTASTTNVFAAHDSTIDGIASVLGLKWSASPYSPPETKDELMPTPPGCGLLFEFDDENDGAVTVTFVYRVFDHSDEFKLSRSKIAHFESMSEFEETIRSGLKKFVGAEECFDKAAVPILV